MTDCAEITGTTQCEDDQVLLVKATSVWQKPNCTKIYTIPDITGGKPHEATESTTSTSSIAFGNS